MRDDHNTDATSLKQRYSSWSDANTGLFSTHSDDPQPFRTAPAPATFHSPHILSQFGPDPLLAITPEKNLGLASLQKTRAYAENRPASPKSRQRVRFAPGTRTSPSEKNVSSDSVERGADLSSGKGDFGVKGHDDSDSQPRSFSFVSQKLYEPGRYSDGDSKLSVEESPGASALVSSASAPKNSVKSTGKSAAYTCVPLGQASGGSVDTSSIDVKAKVIRHTPSSSYPSTVTDDIISASDSDVTQNPPRVKLTKHSSATKTSTSTRSRSPARPSSRSPGRGRSSRPVSPGVSSRSPSRSPGRLTPTESVDYSTLLEDDDPTPPVMVIREAPRQPELGGYVFPFEEKVYDSSENPLARPEFNSTLKISEELKCVKGKRPDTWQAVNQRLKSSNQKRTEIQEKVRYSSGGGSVFMYACESVCSVRRVFH